MPLQRDFHQEPSGASTSSLFMGGHIHQPQPVRATPGSVWGGSDLRTLARPDDSFLADDSYGTTYFPAPENTLGLFSTDSRYAAAAGSPSRPSRYPQSTPPARREIEDYERVGGWTFDASNRTCYIPHGTIKEVNEDEEDMAQDSLADESHTFLNEPLPPETTPPPRPVPRTVPLLPLSLLDCLPLGDGCMPYIDALPSSSLLHHDFSIDDRCTTSSPTILTHSQELNIVEQNLVSIMTGSLDIVSLHATFAALPAPVAADLALCDQVGQALHAVERSLRRRSDVPQEEWRLRSPSCQRKYDHRLISLQKTLRRLHVLSTVPPRVHQFAKLRDMLQHHHAKLADLANKFNATFDRLRYRRMCRTISDLCKNVQRGAKILKEERKTARAAWRPYERILHREGRRSSLVEAMS